MIFKIFCPKKSAKKLAFFALNKAKLFNNWNITLVFEKNAIFSAENCQKSQKTVIISSTPDRGSPFGVGRVAAGLVGGARPHVHGLAAARNDADVRRSLEVPIL
jgi:hypothetical protein